jgi:sigma-B regulation protein RsbU (phosphoserine phosphatase)
MLSFRSIPRPVLLAAATVFAAATILYTCIWLLYIGWKPAVHLGIDWKPEFAHYVTIEKVAPGGPADRAGLRAGDRILAINGYPQHVLTVAPAYAKAKPGDVLTLTIQRLGAAEPLNVPVTTDAAPLQQPLPLGQSLALGLIGYYPVPFLVVGLLVLFLRLEDRNAWLLALMFAGFIAAAPVAFLEGILPPALRRFMLSYMLLLYMLLPPVFYWFFATFPVSSPIDRKLPALKYIFVGAALAFVLPVAGTALVTGSLYWTMRLSTQVSQRLWLPMLAGFNFVCFGLGLVSLIWNGIAAPTPNDRRKIKVMVWGTLAGILPAMLTSGIAIVQNRPYYGYPFWFVVVPILALSLIPVSFAYAVVKHRALEIPVLLKRSARYFLVQRGFLLLILLAGIAATLLLARGLERHLPQRNRMAVPAGAALGIFLVWGGTQMQSRVTRRLDRAFFRSSYDTRQILLDLVVKTRKASSREHLAGLLRNQIDDALHPSMLAIYFRQRDGGFVTSPDVPESVRRLPGNLPVLRHMQERSQPWEIVPTAGDAPALAPLRPLQPECLVPMQGRDGELLGLAVLGPKLSEESYSREDKQLLDSVANQAGIALENIDLAEGMAERLETERRARHEMDIARQVQARLLPQEAPLLKTLECAGKCIQTRAVGGDYYDFLDLGSGGLGLVLADIAGKGISGALLMANLQANLRSQYALALEDIPRLLRSVNRLFYKNTETNHYATTFFAVYDDETRRLRYVNCGHNPPVLLHANGDVERLNATATVLGLFEDWDCEVADCELAAGDVLVIYTDGISEAGESERGDSEEFGEERLIAVSRQNRQQSAAEIMDKILGNVQQFSRGEQADDMTLIVAKCL